MPIEQEVVFATWEPNNGRWVAHIGGEAVTGELSAITRKIAANGWEIISVVPQHSTHRNKNPRITEVLLTGSSEVDVFAIFVKRTVTEPAIPPADLPPPPAP